MQDQNSNSAHLIRNEHQGSIVVGVKDGNIENDKIKMQSNSCGIYNPEGKIYWYDGAIQYSKEIITGTITEIEDRTQILENEGTAYLEIIDAIEWIQNLETGKKYTDLQVAIDETNENDTLQVMQNYTQYEEVIIGAEKNSILDLNGNTINTYGTIRNQGKLLINDSKGNGMITSPVSTTIIQNTGRIEISRRNYEH